MKYFKITIAIAILILFTWCVKRAIDSYKCLYDQPRADIFQSGHQLSMQHKWHLWSGSSAVDYAHDIAALYIDSRFNAGCDTPECNCVRTNIMFRNDVLWKGWKVRLYLPNTQAQWVEMLIGTNGQIREISSMGDFRGAYWVGTFMMTANHRTSELYGGGDNMTAALTAIDIVRLIAGPLVNLYAANVESNDAGGWIVTIGDVTYPDTFHTVGLSKNFSLMSFE